MSKRPHPPAFSPSRAKAKIAAFRAAPSSGSSEPTSANVKVCVRIRPPNDRETRDGKRTVVEPLDDKMLVFDPRQVEDPFFYQGVVRPTPNYLKKSNKEMQFVFDRVFDPATENRDVFDQSTKELIGCLMDGYNCSVFAYGATGAGKTHTMLGSQENPGIAYLTVRELFDVIESHRQDREFEICVSYLEIYNENVQDLLRPTGPLHLRENGKFGVQVAGLYSKAIDTAQELFDMLDKGNKNRTQHPTDANSESSRSHAVFQVYVKMRPKASNQAKIVKLSMIDLAGSERGSATGCKGDRFKEGANINRSLLALGNCINQLAEGTKFIPYRDSKLTRLLKDSLGGNCRTVMIANIGPTCSSYEDTYNTLKYATRASKIQQRIKKNIVSCDGHVSQYIKQADELRERVAQLEAELAKAKEREFIRSVPQIVVEEPDKNVSKWKTQFEAKAEKHFGLMKELLIKKRKQRGFAARAARKYRASLALVSLCGDVSDLQLRDACRKDVARLQLSWESLIRQTRLLEGDIQSLTEKFKTSSAELEALRKEPSAGNEAVNKVISISTLKNDSIFAQAKAEHLQMLSNLQQDEIIKLNTFVKNSLEILKKNYVRLKKQGMFTSEMQEEYNNLIRQAKSSRAVTWEGDQDEIECDDAYYKYLIDLDPEVPNELPRIPQEQISLSPAIIHTESEPESNPQRVVKPFRCDETIVLTDSIDLNTTFTETADTEITEKRDFLDVPPSTGPKPIDPSFLNSTFVLADKSKTESQTKKPQSKVINLKRPLSEKTNVPLNDKVLVLKNKPLPTSKVAPFNKSDATIPSKENKMAVESIGGRFKSKSTTISTPNVQGLKSMRTKNRTALAAVTLPYIRPTPNKTTKR